MEHWSSIYLNYFNSDFLVLQKLNWSSWEFIIIFILIAYLRSVYTNNKENRKMILYLELRVIMQISPCLCTYLILHSFVHGKNNPSLKICHTVLYQITLSPI